VGPRRREQSSDPDSVQTAGVGAGQRDRTIAVRLAARPGPRAAFAPAPSSPHGHDKHEVGYPLHWPFLR
jgi:hypothetical protein